MLSLYIGIPLYRGIRMYTDIPIYNGIPIYIYIFIYEYPHINMYSYAWYVRHRKERSRPAWPWLALASLSAWPSQPWRMRASGSYHPKGACGPSCLGKRSVRTECSLLA